MSGLVSPEKYAAYIEAVKVTGGGACRNVNEQTVMSEEIDGIKHRMQLV